MLPRTILNKSSLFELLHSPFKFDYVLVDNLNQLFLSKAASQPYTAILPPYTNRPRANDATIISTAISASRACFRDQASTFHIFAFLYATHTAPDANSMLRPLFATTSYQP